MSDKSVKVKPKREVERERLEKSIDRDAFSLLRNLIRLHPKEAAEEVEKELRKMRAETA